MIATIVLCNLCRRYTPCAASQHGCHLTVVCLEIKANSSPFLLHKFLLWNKRLTRLCIVATLIWSCLFKIAQLFTKYFIKHGFVTIKHGFVTKFYFMVADAWYPHIHIVVVYMEVFKYFHCSKLVFVACWLNYWLERSYHQYCWSFHVYVSNQCTEI